MGSFGIFPIRGREPRMNARFLGNFIDINGLLVLDNACVRRSVANDGETAPSLPLICVTTEFGLHFFLFTAVPG